jgi:hypothetical protein
MGIAGARWGLPGAQAMLWRRAPLTRRYSSRRSEG